MQWYLKSVLGYCDCTERRHRHDVNYEKIHVQVDFRARRNYLDRSSTRICCNELRPAKTFWYRPLTIITLWFSTERRDSSFTPHTQVANGNTGLSSPGGGVGTPPVLITPHTKTSHTHTYTHSRTVSEAFTFQFQCNKYSNEHLLDTLLLSLPPFLLSLSFFRLLIGHNTRQRQAESQ